MKSFKKWLTFFVLGAFAPLAFSASSVFWVSKGDSKIILGGTIHLLRPADFPLPKEFDHAFERSRLILFESDLSMAKSPEFSKRLAQAMRLSPGKTLDSILHPKVWGRLSAYAARTGFPLENMKPFNAPFLGMMMTVFEAQRQGVTGGVEAYFSQRMEGKLVGELEDESEVLKAMSALAKVDPNRVMASLMRDIDGFSATMDMAVDAWRKGRTEKLYKELAQDMRQNTPEVYDELLVRRHKRWLPKIENLFNSPEIEFVLVGAMHLAGPDSLLKMLLEKGYKVKKYRVFSMQSPRRRSSRS